MPASHANLRSTTRTQAKAHPAKSKEQATAGDEACNDHIYRREFASTAKKMCELGATEADLADALAVDQSTIRLWKSTHKEFSEACRLGAECADEQVEQSLYQRAVGYEHTAEKVIGHKGKAVIVKHRKRIPADVAAGKFWLLNRRSGHWKDPSKIEPAPHEESPLMNVARHLEGTGKRPKE